MSQSFIVVGAGSSGSVVARRLVEAGAEVTVLEAGGPDTDPAIHEPARQGELWHGLNDWDYYTVPQDGAGGRRLHLPRGRVLGGSHALNAMIYVRGIPADYDRWAAAGCDGWAWDDVLPVFKQIEHYDGGSSETRGVDGLLDVVGSYPLHPIQQSIIAAAREAGVRFNPDYNDGLIEGVSQEQVTMRGGRRWSTYLAYLEPVTSRTHLVTGARVHRLVVAGGRVRGVEWDKNGRVERSYADGVVLCAGTIDSPRILMRSGIGSADALRALGIDPIIDLPGVGRNLHDHLISPVILGASREVPGVPSGQSHTQTHLFARSRDGLDAPDTQPIFFSLPMNEPWMDGPSTGFTLMAGMVRPHSRGTLSIAGPSVDDPVLIDLAALREDADVIALEESVRQCRAIGAQSALAEEWGAVECYPGPGAEDPVLLRDYVRKTAITYHHQVGTCKMGIDEYAVVSPTLDVHELDGVWVADASVMPRITTGNTNAPTIMIGERAASFIIA